MPLFPYEVKLVGLLATLNLCVEFDLECSIKELSSEFNLTESHIKEVIKQNKIVVKFKKKQRRTIENSCIIDDKGCWLWQGACDTNGYAVKTIWDKDTKTKTTVNMHKITYKECYGTIPEDLEIDHKCEIKNCVNPKHLEAVTHKENTRRRDRLHRKIVNGDLKVVSLRLRKSL